MTNNVSTQQVMLLPGDFSIPLVTVAGGGV